MKRLCAVLACLFCLHLPTHLKAQATSFSDQPVGRLGKGSLSAVALSPDGKLIALGGSRGIKLYEAATLAELRFITGIDPVESLAFSPDGKTLASGAYNGDIYLWDVATGRETALLGGYFANTWAVAFSPDGKILASGGAQGFINLWDVPGRKEIALLKGHGDTITSLSFSPNGQTLGSGSLDNTVRLWDVASGKQTGLDENQFGGGITHIAFSPNGKTLVYADRKTANIYVDKVMSDGTLEACRNEDGTAISLHYDWGNRYIPTNFMIWGLAFSPTDQIVAWGNPDDKTILWDLGANKLIARLDGKALSMMFSKDGRKLVIGYATGSVSLWDVAGQRQVGVLNMDGYTAPLKSVAYSLDGRFVASGGADFTVRLWDMAGGKQLAVLKGHTGSVYSVAFSPDGKVLASGGADSTVRLWDVAGGRQVAVLKGHSGQVLHVSFSPDGKAVASSQALHQKSNGTLEAPILIWDVAGQKQIGILTGHTSSVYAFAFNPDGKTLVSAAGRTGYYFDETIRLWSLADQKEVLSLAAKAIQIRSMTFNPDGSVLAAGNDQGSWALWDGVLQKQLSGWISSDYEKSTIGLNQVTSLAFSPDGKTVVSGNSLGLVRLWNVGNRLTTGQLIPKKMAELDAHMGPVGSVAYIQNGKILATAGMEDRAVRLWDWTSVASAKQTGSIDFGEWPADVIFLAFSPDGKTLFQATSKDYMIWDVASREIRASIEMPGHHFSASCSPDGKTLASGLDGGFDLYFVNSQENGFVLGEYSPQDIEELHTIWRIPRGGWSVIDLHSATTALAFSPDGKTMASGSLDGSIRLWDVTKKFGLWYEPGQRQMVALLKGHTGEVHSLAFSPDGKTLASGGADFTVRLWDMAGGKQLAVLKGHTGSVYSVAFRPDGKVLASGGWESAIRLWDVAGQKQVAVMEGSDSDSPVAFSPDGKILASGSGRSGVGLWDVAEKKQLTILNGHNGQVVSVAFSPDGKTLASGSIDHTIALWSLAPVSTPSVGASFLASDFNGDGAVDFNDFFLFAAAFGGKATGANANYDLDKDGDVGFGDFFIFAADFGKKAKSGKATTYSPGVNDGAMLSVETVTSEDRLTAQVFASGVAQMRGYGMTVTYDPSALAFVRAERATDTPLLSRGGSTPLFLVQEAQPGRVVLADVIADGGTASGDGALTDLVFRRVGTGGDAMVRVDVAQVFDGTGGMNLLEGAARELPSAYALSQNYPNPFNPATQISYQLPEAGEVSMTVYNLLSQQVRTLVQGRQEAGYYRVTWDGRDAAGRPVSSGLYFYRLMGSGFSETRKMMLLK